MAKMLGELLLSRPTFVAFVAAVVMYYYKSGVSSRKFIEVPQAQTGTMPKKKKVAPLVVRRSSSQREQDGMQVGAAKTEGDTPLPAVTEDVKTVSVPPVGRKKDITGLSVKLSEELLEVSSQETDSPKNAAKTQALQRPAVIRRQLSPRTTRLIDEMTVTVPARKEVNGHVEYLIKLTIDSQDYEIWKRYSELKAWANMTEAFLKNGLPESFKVDMLSPFPGKAFFNHNSHFLDERQQKLQHYLQDRLMTERNSLDDLTVGRVIRRSGTFFGISQQVLNKFRLKPIQC